jgi:hypothetical protein
MGSWDGLSSGQHIYLPDLSLELFRSSHLHSFELARTFLTVLRTSHSFCIHYQRYCIGRSPFYTLHFTITLFQDLRANSLKIIKMYTQTVLIALLAAVAEAR